jgi:hypothetical protein
MVDRKNPINELYYEANINNEAKLFDNFIGISSVSVFTE